MLKGIGLTFILVDWRSNFLVWIFSVIPSLRDLPYSERLGCFRFPSLYYRRRQCDMILVYQLLHDMLDVDAATLFTFATYTSTRGHNFKFCKTRACTNVRLSSFSNWVINDWNNLPANVVDAHSLLCLKKILDWLSIWLYWLMYVLWPL